MREKLLAAVGIISILAAFILWGESRDQKSPSFPTNSVVPSATDTSAIASQFVAVTRIIDGDTIEIEGGKKLRYIGMDTPESGKCGVEESTRKNKELVLGKKVRLEKDISETDKYGRLLRYVYVDNLMVNEELIRLGMARVSTFPPDVKYKDKFLVAEEEAREAGRGLWASDFCQVQGVIQESNDPTALPAQAGQSPNCLIKGNISASGDKIYHLLGCKSYDKTMINTESGERWFCTEVEAVAAGWRKAKNCS
ncbi:thermonuclease family protein [Candidatus Microgenomates bacterium]|nr:thermonuclease family protein [Candidatus Microgenomates bacterium]